MNGKDFFIFFLSSTEGAKQIGQKVRKSKYHNLDFTFGLFDNVN